VVNELERFGYLSRKEGPKSNANLYYLTEKGRLSADKIEKALTSNLKDVTQGIPEEHCKIFRDVYLKIIQNIDNYVKEIIDIVNNNSGIKKIIITGICKHANLALELAYRLKGLKQFEDIKVGVFGTPFLVGCHKCTTTYHRGTPLTPALDNSLKQFPGLDKLVKQYGDYITIVNAHDKSEQDAIKIYALVTYNKDNWTLELENFQTPEIRKSLSGALLIETPQLNTDKCHGAIIHLVLNDTSNKLIQNYLSKAFQNL
jgi:hypothetical protein